MSDNRVRYGRVNSFEGSDILEPKNTLFTIRENDLVYFGISRCNIVAGDKFNKSLGKLIAKNRALKEMHNSGVGGIPGNQLTSDDVKDLQIHKSGLRGIVRLENIKNLLQYFDNIDEVMIPERESLRI